MGHKTVMEVKEKLDKWLEPIVGNALTDDQLTSVSFWFSSVLQAGFLEAGIFSHCLEKEMFWRLLDRITCTTDTDSTIWYNLVAEIVREHKEKIIKATLFHGTFAPEDY